MTARLVCANGVERLMEYLEDLLPAPDRRAVDAHLQGCPRCVAFVKSYVEVPRILRSATQAEMPEGASESLRRFLARPRN
jgi:anti-sigma factor RsiW